MIVCIIFVGSFGFWNGIYGYFGIDIMKILMIF